MVHPIRLKHDLDQLRKAVIQLERLLEELKDETLEEHKRQIIKASIVAVKEIVTARTRDVGRRMRGS
jgi:hypothetical protein